MMDLDVIQFWKDDAVAHKDNCFNKDAPQVAMGLRMSDECVFAELGEEGHPWDYTPPERMRELCRRYNDKAEKIVGKRVLSEDYPIQPQRFPYIPRIGEIFGGRYSIINHIEWLESDVKTPQELEKLLDKVEKMDISDFVHPDNWEKEVKAIYEKTGIKPDPIELWGHEIRGPVTLATSIYGAEKLIFLISDEPELAARFSRAILDAVIKRSKTIDIMCGYNENNFPHGYKFYDDNCCLLTPEMYEEFAYPILKKVFNRWSPDDGDERYQHSDSDMRHIIPILARLKLTACNFGPTVLVDKIRAFMPNTRIDGCISPLAFMNNDEDEISAQVRRDCEMVKKLGCRGLNIDTAGSVNNGSKLTSMRLVMAAIQKYGRY